MDKIDTYLINKHQKISDWFQKWFGLNNFFLARCLCILVLGLIYITTIGNIDFTHHLLSSIFNILFILYVTLAMIGAILTSFSYENKCKEQPYFNNIAAIKDSQKRQSTFILIVFIIAFWLSDIIEIIKTLPIDTNSVLKTLLQCLAMVFYASTMFFLCCTPKPPKKSKVAEFVEKLSPTGILSRV